MATKGRKKKKTKKSNRVFWIAVRIQIALMVVILGFVGYYYLGGYAKTIKGLKSDAINLVERATLDTFKANQTSLVYDAKGQLISTVKAEKDVYYLTFDKIPTDFVDAIISIEDKKFYSHRGIDFKAIVRAALAAIRNGEVTQGGSTITQQLPLIICGLPVRRDVKPTVLTAN